MVIACVVFTPEDVWLALFTDTEVDRGGRPVTVGKQAEVEIKLVSNHVWVTVHGTHSLAIAATE